MTLRRRLKDMARFAIDAAAPFSSRLPRRPAARILNYHEVLDQTLPCPNPYNQVSADRLAAQIDRLLVDGYTILTVTELHERLRDPAAALGGLVALTFDDGLEEHVDRVLPILERRNVRATFYVISGRVGMASELGRGTGRHLGRSQLERLASAGMEIGSHGRSHAVLSRLTPAAMDEEIGGSREDLRAMIGAEARSFAYPYGSRSTFGPAVTEAVRRAGYDNAVSTVIGANRHGAHPFELRRLPVYGTDTPSLVVARARGGFDWMGRLQDHWLRALPHHSTRQRIR